MFILAGEGNIEGFASAGHLHQLVFPNDSTAVPQYQHLVNTTTGQFLTRDDVFVTYDHHRGDELLHGPLSMQYGGDAGSFGPELQMGHVLGDLYEEPVVIVKAGWKGRSLAKDFASPSTNNTGFQWYRLISSIHNTANSLHEILGPKYKYSKPDIGGLVWWHGYKDLADTEMTLNYGKNLELFMQDIRDALKQPWMPIIVAELGGQGVNTTDQNELQFRQMQQQVVNESFAYMRTVYVPTAPYVKTDVEIKDYTLYYGRADTMIEISQAFAVALAHMDFEKTSGASNDWFAEESDVSMQRYKTWFQFHYIKIMFLVGAVAFVVFAVVWNKGDFRRTWNTARSRFQSLTTTELELEDVNEDDASEELAERPVPELRDT